MHSCVMLPHAHDLRKLAIAWHWGAFEGCGGIGEMQCMSFVPATACTVERDVIHDTMHVAQMVCSAASCRTGIRVVQELEGLCHAQWHHCMLR